VLWLTPLRALAADTTHALRASLEALGIPWEVETRTGDTPAALRARQRRQLPEALITTPESLSLLLSYPEAATQFGELRAVIVDEWHELLGSRRGVQAELCLARLRRWRPGLRIWGLSATLGNLDTALAALLGVESPFRREHGGCGDPVRQPAAQPGRLIRGLLPKPISIEALIPEPIERFPWAGHLGLRMLPQVLDVIASSATALVFANTRAQTETWYQAILEARPEWAGQIALHHGSLDRATREWVEQALRDGRVRCVVCTSSLDLGVDFSPVESVVQIGSPRGVARLLQRAGRSGHQPGAESRVVCAPTSALELIEIAAVREAAAAGAIEARQPLEHALDVLVQHMVTIALGGGFSAGDLLDEVRTTYAYRNLSDAEWAWALDFVTRGGPALRAYPEYARVVERAGRYIVEDGTIARRHRASIGTIVSDAAIGVQFLRGGRLGQIEEAFVARLKPGDRFVFAGRVLEFVRVRDMTAWVRLAAGRDAIVPRWSGGRMALSPQLAAAVRDQLDAAAAGVFESAELRAVAPILAIQARWSRIPAHGELLVERLRTREGQHLFCYPLEGRLVHEGLAALLAYRIAQRQPISFTIAVNDYGFELLGSGAIDVRLDGDGLRALLSTEALEQDILASLNATEMARRQFREIARVAGLVYQGYPGEKNARQLQASSGLIFDVLARYDDENPLLRQAYREVLDRQLEQARLRQALSRMLAGRVTVVDIARPTPLAFPLLVDRLRDTLTSEKLADRVRRMQLALERAL
jgi:ATP-dependent Lhr-like helicase